MGLSRNIIVKNEFTRKTADGTGGTRGGTPGAYVERYMARERACETLTPVQRFDSQNYIERYMMRSEATDIAPGVVDLKDSMRDIDGMGGVAFSRDTLSLSSEAVKSVSAFIQEQFDSGKTVLKTVLSFEHEYLLERGIVDPMFEFAERGDYRGNIDQMKLRHGISEGMRRLSSSFNDLVWVGVIQVDTAHVHCHLAMVDAGLEMPTAAGGRVGMLYKKDKAVLRRGVDEALDDMRSMHMMTSNIAQDRRNVRCFVKRYTHDALSRREFPQFLLACLPADTASWQANSHSPQMRKANEVARGFVRDVMHERGSGYRHALRNIQAYARERAVRESLGPVEQQKLVRRGVSRLEAGCVNALYDELRHIPEELRRTETPMLDVMSMDIASMAASAEDDPMIEFAFKLSSYSSRLNHHREQRTKYHGLVKQAETADVTVQSQPLLDFYRFEEIYQGKCMAKYLHFLHFLPGDEELEEELEAVYAAYREAERAAALARDFELRSMNVDEAEREGKIRYGVAGGRFAPGAHDILERRETSALERYELTLSDTIFNLEGRGYTVNVEQDETGEVRFVPVRELMWEFDEVKAVDIHHLRYDFARDIEVSDRNIDIFIDETERRSELLRGAIHYLESSGQGHFVSELPVTDVERAVSMTRELQQKKGFATARTEPDGKKRRIRTVSLDDDYMNRLSARVVDTIAKSTQTRLPGE